jgi:hypothetical protein
MDLFHLTKRDKAWQAVSPFLVISVFMTMAIGDTSLPAKRKLSVSIQTVVARERAQNITGEALFASQALPVLPLWSARGAPPKGSGTTANSVSSKNLAVLAIRLRHSENMLAASAGASLREPMDRIGHDSERAAMVYLHGSDKRQQAIADTLSQLAIDELKRGSNRSAPAPRGGRSGTQTPRGFLTMDGSPRETGADLRRRGGAPTATRTRDLLLRRRFHGIAR